MKVESFYHQTTPSSFNCTVSYLNDSLVTSFTLTMEKALFLFLFFHFSSSFLILYGDGAQCEPVKIPMCKFMPYNMTRMPNHLHHSTQQNAVLAIEPYQELVDTNCSDRLVFFLCSMFAPICTVQFQQDPIPPCRRVCERARKGCEPIMNHYNVSWPDALDCQRLPMYERGVCISPAAIVSTRPQDGYSKDANQDDQSNAEVVTTVAPDCTCPKGVRLKRDMYASKKYDYVISGKFVKQQLYTDHVVTVISVQKVIKHGDVHIKKGNQVHLWTLGSCVCPKIAKSKRAYLIVGYEDKKYKRLLLNKECVVTRWRKSWQAKIQKWDVRLRSGRSSVSPTTKSHKRNKKRNKKRKGRKRKNKKKTPSQ